MTVSPETHDGADSADKPLIGRTVVITRPRAQADEFVAELERYGARVVVCPTIEIAAPKDYEHLDEAIAHLFGYDWVVFTSVNGVQHFLDRFNELGLNLSEMDEVRVCAIGTATEEKLSEAHIHVDLVPQEFNAEGIFRALEQFLGGTAAISGLNFLIPRAAVARDYLPKALEAAGARVDVVTAYRTIVPGDLDRGRIGAMLAGGTDCIAFTSPSTVKNLGLLFDTQDLSMILEGVAVASIGDITAQAVVEHGLRPEIQPKHFTIPALAQAIAEYFTKHER